MHTRLILLMLLLVTLGCPTDPGAADDDDATAGDDDDATAGDDDDATAGDDDDATAGDDDDATGVPGPYPPIYIVVNAHGHNYGYTSAVQKISTNNSQYEAHRAEVLWLADETAAYGARMSFQLNGEYARDARLAGHTQEILDLEAAGHAIAGVHYHSYYFTGANEYWASFSAGSPEADANGWVEQAFDDHVGEVELLVGRSVDRIDPASGTKAETEALMDAHGVPIAPGGEVFSYTDWNMKPWTPFRAAPGTYLQHDATGPRVGLASIGQLGQSSAEGLHAINASVPQLKRHFLMVLSEWREHERNGEPPQIWTFGVMTHPDKNNKYRAEVTELLAFFNSFTAEVTDRGNPVAQFATDVEVAAVYEAWEGANPDGERLDFNWLEHREGNTQPFPYLMEGVVNGLLHCELDEATPELDLGGDVRAFKLWKRDQALGPPDAEGRRGLVNIGDLLHAVYLLWSDGDDAVVDLSSETSGTVYVMNGITGATSTADVSAVTVPGTPVIVSTEAF
mgnify:CR=1 FL=1